MHKHGCVKIVAAFMILSTGVQKEALSVLMLFALSCINTEIVSYNFKGSTASIVLINTRFPIKNHHLRSIFGLLYKNDIHVRCLDD